MIKKIILNNFQSHKHSVLEFDPGVNAIIGNSDSGKTSIIRALYWLVFNRPSGNAFRSKWGGKTIVGASVDGVTIKRIKDDNLNKYTMGGQEWKAGTTVPEDVSKVLNIKDINFARQMDSPFMIFDTSGERSKLINKVTKMDLIDVVQTNISSMDRNCNNEIKRELENLLECDEEIEKYKDVDKAKKDLESLIEKSQTIESMKCFISSVEEKIKELKRLQDEKEKICSASISEGLSMLEKISKKEDRIKEENKKISEIDSVLSSRDTWKKRKTTIEKDIERMEESLHEAFEELEGKECPLCGQIVEG